MSMLRELARLLPLLLLAGCETVSYRMIPPPSETGRLCVTQCAGNQEVCLDRETRAAESERHSCEHRREYEYRRCMGRSEGQREKQQKCERQRGYCGTYVNRSGCEEAYRNCYAGCGGTVIREVEKW